MHVLPADRKLYLLRQHTQYRASTANATPPQSPSKSSTFAASFGPSSGSSLLPRLVPQLTGDMGLMKRFSITGWGGTNAAPPVVSPGPQRSSGESHLEGGSAQGKGKAQVEKMGEEMRPLQPQTTGGLWNNWWASSGGENSTPGEKGSVKEIDTSAKWYVDGLRSRKPTDIKLVRHLISLRVHLSTASLVWIESFVGEEQGLEALGTLLSGLVGKGGKRRILTDVETSNLLEVVKCLRVLLNTEVGRSIHSNERQADVSCIAWLQTSPVINHDNHSHCLFDSCILHQVANPGVGTSRCYLRALP